VITRLRCGDKIDFIALRNASVGCEDDVAPPCFMAVIY